MAILLAVHSAGAEAALQINGDQPAKTAEEILQMVEEAAEDYIRDQGIEDELRGEIIREEKDDPFGGEDFYDEDGHHVGYSVPGVFGGRTFYDANGNRTGYSVDALFGGENYYDDNGERQGYSVPGVFGGSTYYDDSGANVGYSTPGLIAGEHMHLNDDLFGLAPPDDHSGPDDW